MSNQIVITSGAKVRSLEGVLTGTSGLVGSVPLGAANGVATLDSGGKVPVSQLPSSVVTYLGTWNAATNTPTLVNGVGDAGDMYICNVAGTVNFGAGPVTFAVGDWVLYGSGTWQKSNGQNGTVTSVGASITGNAIGLTGSPITTAGTLAFAFSGTSGQYVNGAGNLTTFPTLITSIGLSMPSAFSVANSPLTANGSINVTGAGTVSQYIDGTGALQTFPALTGYVPYTGATTDVDLGTHVLNAQALHVKGTAGAGHLGLKHQTATPTGSANESLIFADVNGNLGWLNDNLYLTTLVSNANTANRSYTFPNASGTLALTSDISYPVTSVFGRTGAVTAQSGDYTTTLVTEGTRLYYTDTRARAALSFTAGSGAYNSTTGVITIPTNNNQITNGAGYITLTSLSAGTGISYNNLTGVISSTITQYTDAMARAAISGGTGISYNSTTGVITNTITQYTDALARAAISLTTTGTSGAATYNSTTGVLNIPQYTDAYTGTVTSVAMTVPTGLSVSGSPITTSGTLAVTLTAGYSIPTTASQTNWDTAYTNRITSATSPLSITSNVISISQATTSTSGYLSSTDWNTFNSKQGTITLTTTGSSGAATFVGNTLNIPNYGSALSGYLPLTGGTLTGALNGTSATWSGEVGITSGSILNINYGGIYTKIYNNYLRSNTGTFYFDSFVVGGVFVVRTSNASLLDVNALTISSTGAATFASSVTANAASTINGAYPQLILNNPSAGAGIELHFKDNGTLKSKIGTLDDINSWQVYNGGAIRFTINNSGNIGIGTTSPSAKLQVDDGAGAALYIGLSTNNYYRAYEHIWQGISGTTERMRITSGGNLLIGTTTDAGYKLDVNGTGRFSGGITSSVASGSSALITLKSGSGESYITETDGNLNMVFVNKSTLNVGANVSDIRFCTNNNTTTPALILAITGAATFSSSVTATSYSVNTNGNGITFTNTAGAASGKVYQTGADYLGLISGGSGIQFKSSAAANLVTITEGGNVLIGTTSDDGVNKLQVNGSIAATSTIAAVVPSNVDMFVFNNTGATYTKSCVVASMTATGGTGSYFFYGQQSTSTVALKIFSNGNIQNTNNSYGAISDARLKENITDATPKLDDLLKVKVRNYNLKGEKTKQLGVISQELEEIFPNMIEESTNLGENVKIKGVKYSVFVPMLIKAVQELKAEIETLKNK